MEMKKQLDIFDFIINSEKDGRELYLKYSEQFSHKELKDLFLRLADEENNHIEEFLKIKLDSEKKGLLEPFTVPEIDEYLESIIHEGLFPKRENANQQIDQIKSVGAACAFAMQAEKNSVLLYSELAGLCKNKSQRSVFEKIAKEEKSHMVTVRQLRADYDPMYAALSFGRFF